MCAVCVQVWVSVGTDPRSDEFEAGSAPKFQKRRAVDGPTRLMRLSRGLGVGGGGGGGGGGLVGSTTTLAEHVLYAAVRRVRTSMWYTGP